MEIDRVDAGNWTPLTSSGAEEKSRTAYPLLRPLVLDNDSTWFPPHGLHRLVPLPVFPVATRVQRRRPAGPVETALYSSR